MDESIKRSTDRSRYYYDLIKETISLLKQYSDVLVMLQIDPDNTKYQQEKETLSREYPPMLRKLMYIDRVHHSISWNHTKNVFDLDRLANAPVALKQGDLVEAEDCYRVLNLDHPKDPVILHNWVLCGGKWSSFSEMKITDYSTQYYISILIGRLIEARQFSPDNYHSFYDFLFELIKLMIGYYENELESKAEEYETVKMRLQEKFDRSLSDFIKTDSELFGGTVSS